MLHSIMPELPRHYPLPSHTMTRSLISLLALSAAPVFAASGELKAAAQKLSETHRDAVVWITVIAKTSMTTDGDAPQQIKAALQGQDKETKSEATGTVVDASGLIVTSLAAIDKGSVVDGKTINTPMGPIKIKSATEIKEVKVIMPDGTEIPGDLVMKDADLGLGFIKVRMDSKEAQGVTFKSVDLADSAPGTMLDDCIGLGRLDDNLNREPSVITSEITGITTKPRTFYRVMTDATGTPVFLSSGKLLGISVVRQPRGNIEGGSVQMSPVVLPAADVLKVAEQAKTAKPEEKKPEPAEEKKEETKEEKPEEPKKEEPKPDGAASKDS